MKRYLEQDVIAVLESWDVDGLTMKKFHYDREKVDFNEVYADIVPEQWDEPINPVLNVIILNHNHTSFTTIYHTLNSPHIVSFQQPGIKDHISYPHQGVSQSPSTKDI